MPLRESYLYETYFRFTINHSTITFLKTIKNRKLTKINTRLWFWLNIHWDIQKYTLVNMEKNLRADVDSSLRLGHIRCIKTDKAKRVLVFKKRAKR